MIKSPLVLSRFFRSELASGQILSSLIEIATDNVKFLSTRVTIFLCETMERTVLISSQKGFICFYTIDRTGRRILEWHRSSRVDMRSVKHLEKIIGKLPVDVIKIVFVRKVQITEDALEYLKSKYEVLLEKYTQTAPLMPTSVNFYDGNVVIISNGRVRFGESDRVPLNDNKNVWLLVISIGNDGKIRIFDESPTLLDNIISEAQRRNDKVVIFAIWHGKWKTDAFLMYPPTP